MELLFTVLIMLGPWSLESSPDKYTLRFQPKTGEQVAWMIDMDMDMVMKPAGMDMTMDIDMDMGIGMHLEVLESGENDLVRMGTTVDSMRMDMSGMPGMDVQFNSNASASDAAGQAMQESLGPLLGTTIVSQVDAFGEVQSMEGYEELLEQMGGGGGMGGMSSNPFENFQSYLAVYPKNKLKIGDSWEHSTLVSSNGAPMEMANTYTLQSVENGQANIGVVSTVRMDEVEMEQSGMAMSMSMTGTQSGIMVVRVSDGMTLSADMEQNFVMDMETMGMSMPATIKGHYTLLSINR